MSGVPGRARTCNLLIRSQVLYPIELRVHYLLTKGGIIERCAGECNSGILGLIWASGFAARPEVGPYLACEGVGEGLDEGADLVTYTAVGGECHLGGSGLGGEEGWVVEADMDHAGLSRKERAGFVGVGADGDDVVEGDVEEIIDALGTLLRDIDADLGHHGDGVGVEAVRFNAGGIGVDSVALQGTRPALSHLAATGVSGAKKEELDAVRGGCHAGRIAWGLLGEY